MPIKMSEVLEDIFHEQEDFIIIGLTGRTGSGCSTVADILTRDNIDLNDPLNSENIGNEDRKVPIVYNFIKKKWKPFTKIKASDIITSFIFDYANDFLQYIQGKYGIAENAEVRPLYNDLKQLYVNQDLNLKKEDYENPEHVYKFYFEELPKFSNVLKKWLGDNYTTIFQDIGDNLRSKGTVDENLENEEKLLKLPERINSLIKVARDFNKLNGKKDYFVIDAIRNPFESLFFKQRFSAFYLISINTPNDHRIERLVKIRKLNYRQIEELDQREYPDTKNNLVVLNIQSCIENADIHIENPNNDIPGDFSKMKYYLAKYISLIMHPGLITPTKVERCMQIAYTAKFNSGCISRQVGAVVTDQDYAIKSVGWNDTPYGQTPCLLRSVNNLINNHDLKAYSDYELKDKDFKEKFTAKYSNSYEDERLEGRNFSYCFKDEINEFKNKSNQVYTRSLHAEENAFLQIAKYGGIGVKDGILFTTASPCELCSKKAYQLGIKKIIFIDPYPGISQSHILNCGYERPVLELFSGAIGRAYHKLYEPIMPYKDEIYILLGNADRPEE